MTKEKNGTIKLKNFFNSFLSSMGTGLTQAPGFFPPLAHFGSMVSLFLASPRFRFSLASGVAAALALGDFLAAGLQEGESLDFGVRLVFDFGAALAFDFGAALARVRRAGFLVGCSGKSSIPEPSSKSSTTFFALPLPLPFPRPRPEAFPPSDCKSLPAPRA